MRMTLRAVTDDGYFFALDDVDITIFIVVNLHFDSPVVMD